MYWPLGVVVGPEEVMVLRVAVVDREDWYRVE